VDSDVVGSVVFAWRLPLFFSTVAAMGTARGGSRLVVMGGACDGTLAIHVGTLRLLLCHHCG
jgi:ascorbate-specific PTS system EIIC-type component UlaA